MTNADAGRPISGPTGDECQLKVCIDGVLKGRPVFHIRCVAEIRQIRADLDTRLSPDLDQPRATSAHSSNIGQFWPEPAFGRVRQGLGRFRTEFRPNLAGFSPIQTESGELAECGQCTLGWPIELSTPFAKRARIQLKELYYDFRRLG